LDESKNCSCGRELRKDSDPELRREFRKAVHVWYCFWADTGGSSGGGDIDRLRKRIVTRQDQAPFY